MKTPSPAPSRPDPLSAVSHPDILPRHQAIARRILGMLPTDCQAKLYHFYVVYNDPGHRGLAGKGVIIMNGSLPDSEFAALLLHEGFGHFWDLTCAEGTAASGESGFRDAGRPIYADDPSASFYALSWNTDGKRKARSQERDFVSGYAYATDPFEDLAESVTYYVLQKNAFQKRAQANPILAQKFAWLEAHFPRIGTIATGSDWRGKIPWDAGKVAFTWSAGVL